ncbi:hypothetical protein EDB83DRAFT_953554 [Lactarius deliciosus]|nr:hypothetical protein EDB83DRAFT_953554 [Lactarius deliciosus]
MEFRVLGLRSSLTRSPFQSHYAGETLVYLFPRRSFSLFCTSLLLSSHRTSSSLSPMRFVLTSCTCYALRFIASVLAPADHLRLHHPPLSSNESSPPSAPLLRLVHVRSSCLLTVLYFPWPLPPLLRSLRILRTRNEPVFRRRLHSSWSSCFEQAPVRLSPTQAQDFEPSPALHITTRHGRSLSQFILVLVT